MKPIIRRRKQRERIPTECAQPEIIKDIRKDMNMNELRAVESATKAKRKLQRKYYQSEPIEVQSIGESIHDRVNFDRRLKLFLHRQKKLELLSFLDQSTRKSCENTLCAKRETEAERLFRQVAPKWKPGSNRKLIDCTLFLSRSESPEKTTNDLKEAKPKSIVMKNRRYQTEI